MTAIAIVAHQARRKMAEHLAGTIQADHINWDDGTLGCSGNHQAAWEWHAANNTQDWAVVLEDDAVPVDGFYNQLEQALTAAPTDIVSLYLGRSYPKGWQTSIEQAVNTADNAGAHWIVSDHLLHAVGVTIRTELINDAVIDFDLNLPIDDAITEWARRQKIPIGYTWPSLIDHRDEPTVIPLHRRTKPRKAWRTGARAQWTPSAVELTNAPRP